MIKNINAGPFLTVNYHGSDYISLPAPSMSSGYGMMRYNQNSANIEVYDGQSWRSVSATADVSLSPEAVELLGWAKGQKERDEKLKLLAATYPTVKDALDAVAAAEEKLRVVEALVQQ